MHFLSYTSFGALGRIDESKFLRCARTRSRKTDTMKLATQHFSLREN